MTKKDVYDKTLSEASEIRFDLDETHGPIMRNYGKVFKFIFEEASSKFKLVKDMMYYKGGYPKPTSPARLLQLADKFGIVYKYYSILGKQNEIHDILKTYGITINIDANVIKDIPVSVDSKNKKKFDRVWNSLYGTADVPKMRKELLELILMEAMEEQGTICKMADEIKITAADKVEEECNIGKPVFVRAVKIKTKTLKNKPIDEDIERIERGIEHTESGIIEQFK